MRGKGSWIGLQKISWLLGLAENDENMIFAKHLPENSDLLFIFWAREM